MIHRFAGLQRHPDENDRRWRWTCECGDTGEWVSDKDDAWRGSVQHHLPYILTELEAMRSEGSPG